MYEGYWLENTLLYTVHVLKGKSAWDGGGVVGDE